MTTPEDWWATAISDIHPGIIRLRGYPIEELILDQTYAGMVWLMLRGERPTPWQARLLDAALVAAVDHGPQAPSIAAARMAATCGIGINNAVATGVNMLGDVHGGAGEQCMTLLTHVRARVVRGEDVDAVAAETVDGYRARRQYLPGFGHRFHPEDPRRDPLLGLVADAVEADAVGGEYLVAAVALENRLAYGRPKPVPMNIDGATAVIYSELGFPPPLGRGLFVLSRSVGILAHAWEESQNGQRIKGPIPRPLLASYTGPAPRSVV